MVHRRRGQFFVRLVLKRAGMSSYGKASLTTAIDFYVDSGTGEWLIPRCGTLPSCPPPPSYETLSFPT